MSSTEDFGVPFIQPNGKKHSQMRFFVDKYVVIVKIKTKIV